MAPLPPVIFRRTPSGYRDWVFTKRPINLLEEFGSDGVALRPPSTPVKPDEELEMELDRLSKIRYHLARRPTTSHHVIGALDEVLKQYYIAVHTAVQRVNKKLSQQLYDMNDFVGGQLAYIAAADPCRVSLPRRKAKKQAEILRAHLASGATRLAEVRKQALLSALEDMYRQCTLNAFLTSSLAREARPYVYKGVVQGYWDHAPILPSALEHPANFDQAWYTIQVVWISSSGATLYPSFIVVDRNTNGSFAKQYVNWIRYRPNMNNDYDLEETEDGEHTICQSHRTTVEVRVRCSFVKEVVIHERVVQERLELLEKAHVVALGFWKSLFYKPGDFQKNLESPSQVLLHPYSW